MKKFILYTLILSILLLGCSPYIAQAEGNSKQLEDVQSPPELQQPAIQNTETPQPEPESVLQPFSQTQPLGPDSFPENYNPLTGRPAADPSMLDIPAMLVSISHFPPVARPQAGLSYAPFVYEFTITEGSTRHLAAFYGEYPTPEIPLHGDCEVRTAPITQTGLLLGNRVWHDENANGTQDVFEGGIGGLCINLYDTSNNLLQQTTTDSNGYYAFNVEAGQYVIEFVKPAWLEFTQKNIGYEDQDSDADQESGRAEADVQSTLLYLDAGLIPSESILPPDSDKPMPKAQVGPVRSGRLLYDHIGKYYQYSCLVYAGADPDVRAEIPSCATVPHTAKDGGAMLELERMMRIADENAEGRTNFNYASNLYSETVPTGGQPATQLFEFWGVLNQSKWEYDAASESYWRYVDKSNPDSKGVFFNYIDRLNGRQIQFENIALLFVRHEVVTPTIIEMHMELGEGGNGFMFRDGQVFEIKWSTRAGDYEQTTGLRRPIQFQTIDKAPFALKPGRTWVIIFDLGSYLEQLAPASWKARFVAPPGAK